ncbi:MAG: hypothetical protein ACI8RZ_005831 [Myxococcota bacterium]|jgi:hypothetical protein
MLGSNLHSPDSVTSIIIITVILGWSLELLVRGLL